MGDSPAHLAGAEVECLYNGLQDLAVSQRELVLVRVKYSQFTSQVLHHVLEVWGEEGM